MRWQQLRNSTAAAWALVATAAVLLLVSVLVLMQATSRPSASDAVTGTSTVTLQKDETLRITYLGDSLTAGLFATTEEDTYRYLTTTTLAGGGPYEENALRLVGGTVEQTLEGNDEFPSDQHVHIVALGTNDITRVDYKTFNTQYEELLDRVREASPDTALVCLGTWRPTSRGANYDLAIRQQCESHGGSYRRLSDLEGEPTNKGPAGQETYAGLSDDFHPNDAGHAAIFERVMTAIEVRRTG